MHAARPVKQTPLQSLAANARFARIDGHQILVHPILVVPNYSVT